MSTKEQTEVINYAEYHTMRVDGSATDVTRRLNWTKQLNVSAAEMYYIDTSVTGDWVRLGDWLAGNRPCGLRLVQGQ